jgi:DNA-directed RNA polymerase specialized sigma24 family protein
MASSKPQHRRSTAAVDVEKLLSDSYSQLLKWANVLTRGDEVRSQDLVQELCLYFTVTRPNLSHVINMEGYLYTCLRHLYVSGLARSSREALHFVSVAECDSIEFALAPNHTGDPLQRQNDLRRICHYAVWRKKTSKSASYFILHFFHGYGRQEVADLARLPISAIYNKLKIARTEVKAHLEDEGKFRIMKRDNPPVPTLSWDLVTAPELFTELRQTILESRMTECLEEEELLAHYDFSFKVPISCELLAHIVSCERCLLIIDRHLQRPTLKDRDTLDTATPDLGPSASPVSISSSRRRMMQKVRRRWERVHEHRPRILSIAVDGKIIASHDVEAEHSKLSARIHTKDAEFVEVFSEQDVRFALLPIGKLPPTGPGLQSQRISLSDSRWLELTLTFDGLGLNGQVSYFDPALAVAPTEEEEEEVLVDALSNQIASHRRNPRLSWVRGSVLDRLIQGLFPIPAMAWALLLIVLAGSGGYLAYRHSVAQVDAKDILNRSLSVESTELRGQTEHQLLRVEEIVAPIHTVQLGSVEVLEDGDNNRQVRRLYDTQNRLIMAHSKNGKLPEQSYRSDLETAIFGTAAFEDLWTQDLSIRTLSKVAGDHLQVARRKDGYDLIATGPLEGHPHVISLSVTLDRNLHPTEQIVRVRDGGKVREFRLVQTLYERTPSASVPDTRFDLGSANSRSSQGSSAHSSIQSPGPQMQADEVQLAELKIAVLYQLNKTESDINQPIEISQTPNARIQITGTVADDARLRQIRSGLEALPNQQSLLVRLTSPHEAEVHPSGSPRIGARGTTVFDVGPAKPLADVFIRSQLQARGLAGERLEQAYAQFSHDALQHSQFALQHAYALQRLGQVLPITKFRSIDRASQHNWAVMVQGHSSRLEQELRALNVQMGQLSPPGTSGPDAPVPSRFIQDPSQIRHVSDELLTQTQELNRNIGLLFASYAAENPKQDVRPLLTAARLSIPLHEAADLSHFANQLIASETPVKEK